MTALQIINILTALATLATKMGINFRDVSDKIADAHDEGRTLSDDELQDMAADWRETDAAEQAAYENRMQRND